MSDLNLSWQTILNEAISKPGSIHEAYSLFWNYSIGNQLLALVQCYGRGIAPGPIGSFMHWKALGRNVRKGEKAIVLCMPITGKRSAATSQPATDQPADEPAAADQPRATFTRFIYKPHWFVLAQTEGADYQPADLPTWNKAKALEALGITETPYDLLSGNAQGYALRNSVSISPIAALPHKTLFHELAHVVLGHTAEGNLSDSEHTPRNLREIEAECVALLCCESLALPGTDYSRGYIQHWGSEIPEKSAQKIFHAADQILKAGRVEEEHA